MRICAFKLTNFRGVKHAEIILPRHAVLLGANNCGKSTIAEAVALLFAREGVLRPLSDWDFHGGEPKPDTRFSIVATITGFGDADDTDPTHFPRWFVGEKAARPVWWNEEQGTLCLDPDAPPGFILAAQLALCARYEEETCEFETIRHFFDGESDPFTDDYRPVAPTLLRELGVFLLPSARDWDKLLAFSSSSFLKLVREYEALPGNAVEELKNELRNPRTRVEEQQPFASVLRAAEEELRAFSMLDATTKMAYRPTSLDSLAVLRSLTPHLLEGDGRLLPLARHGAGMVSLQAFLILLAFAEYRRKTGRNFIFVAEEPELHLYPALHQRLVSRIRNTSTQSIVTTHSPGIAAAYEPREVLFVRNDHGELSATALRREPVSKIPKDSVKKLYLAFRPVFYEALLGGAIILPEGTWDYHWLSLWQRVVQACGDCTKVSAIPPLTVVPTQDAAVVDTFAELCRLRSDVTPLIDGDPTGDTYRDVLVYHTPAPARLIQLGAGAAIEALVAWIVEPVLSAESLPPASPLPIPDLHTPKDLLRYLVERKRDFEFHEELAWWAGLQEDCIERATGFFHDISQIATSGQPLTVGWAVSVVNGVQIFTAEHVRKPS